MTESTVSTNSSLAATLAQSHKVLEGVTSLDSVVQEAYPCKFGFVAGTPAILFEAPAKDKFDRPMDGVKEYVVFDASGFSEAYAFRCDDGFGGAYWYPDTTVDGGWVYESNGGKAPAKTCYGPA